MPSPPEIELPPCKNCGGPRRFPKVRRKDVPLQEYVDDDYCSTECCKADLGIEDPRSPLVSTSGRLGRQGQRCA